VGCDVRGRGGGKEDETCYIQNITDSTMYSSVLVSGASLNSSSGRQKLEKYAFRILMIG
jgi:hypothetical protein